MLLVLIILLMVAAPSVEKIQERLVWARLAHDNLISFARLTMPSADDPTDVSKSRYEVGRHHVMLSEELADVAFGQAQRLIIVMPPRHGKSELAVRRFVPWFLGRNPSKHVIVATYTAGLAWEHGRDVRGVMKSTAYRAAFPKAEAQLMADSQASDRLATEGGGKIHFTGLEGSITGKGADVFIIDDPIKGSKEARSKLIRDNIWHNFLEVCLSRLMTHNASVVIITTRWHEDDIVGRLVDQANEHCNPESAKAWKVLHLRALIESPTQSGEDPLHRLVGESLWPERFSAEHLRTIRDVSPPLSIQSFGSIYQGDPSPEQGSYFKSEWLKTYTPAELPNNLRRYVTSDHALRAKAANDLNCILPFGVDESGVIWILPSVWWERAETDVLVDEMLKAMKTHKPITWWAAKDNIAGSIGPFLRKRMFEEKIFIAIDEVPEVVDLQQRAQAIKGRMAMGMVRFPAFWPMWDKARQELLKFPNAGHDDFIAALALAGMGLDRIISAENSKQRDNQPKPGSLDWVKYSSRQEEWNNRRNDSTKGY